MKAEEILDMIHQIRETRMEKYRDQPDEVFLHDLHSRTAKVCEELGLKPAAPRGGAGWPSTSAPKAWKRE